MLTPQRAGQIEAHLHRLTAAGITTPHEFMVARTLLWRLRRMTQQTAKGTFESIAKLAGVCRTVAVRAVKKLEAIGLLYRHSHKPQQKLDPDSGKLLWQREANSYVWKAEIVAATPTVTPWPVRPIGKTRPLRKEAHEQEATAQECQKALNRIGQQRMLALWRARR